MRLNAGPQDVFVWDIEVELFRAIDDNAGVMPVGLEKVISAKLQIQDLNQANAKRTCITSTNR